MKKLAKKSRNQNCKVYGYESGQFSGNCIYMHDPEIVNGCLTYSCRSDYSITDYCWDGCGIVIEC